MLKSERVKRNLKKLASMVNMRTPSGWGFCIMIFPFKATNEAQYICSAQREDMIKVLREYANHLEGHSGETSTI